MTARVAILISGGGSNMVRLVADMQTQGYGTPVLVLSNRPDAGGLRKAQDMGVPTAVVDHTSYENRAAFEQALLDQLERFRPDVICLAGFMRVLGAGFIARYAGRILNIHPSLLPKYKGLNTHARALDAGDEKAGCSVHIVTKDLDDGPILGQATVPVHPSDKANTLAQRILVMEHLLYPKVLRHFLADLPLPVFLP